ncbi:MAG: hypothetical protein ACQERK_01990 [Campylobacterota bacterium]
MGAALSLLYAPLVFFAVHTFDIATVAVFVAAASCIWLILTYKNGWISMLYPFMYLAFALFAFIFQHLVILKAIPVVISLIVAAVFIISYAQKRSVILYFAKRFHKRKLTPKEQHYIHRSTLFWITVTVSNVAIHLYALLGENLAFWAFYGSVGGYGLLGLAALAQFLHKRFIFDAQQNWRDSI